MGACFGRPFVSLKVVSKAWVAFSIPASLAYSDLDLRALTGPLAFREPKSIGAPFHAIPLPMQCPHPSRSLSLSQSQKPKPTLYPLC